MSASSGFPADGRSTESDARHVNLLPDADQREIIATAASLLAKEFPLGRGTGENASGSVDASWRRLGGLGWFALAVPSAEGGAGYSLVEEALLFRELGRALLPGPVLATVLAAKAAVAGGASDWFEQLASGERTAGLAEPYRDPGAEVGRVVRGRFRLVDATGAGVLLVTDRSSVALIEATEVADREVFEPIDASSTVEVATIDSARSLSVVLPDQIPLAAQGSVLLAAALVGICEATRDQSVAYASQRVQFDKPIGSFQAVKHRCADMSVRAEAAGALTFYAALALRDGFGDAGRLVKLAKALAGDYAQASAADNIQNHGGMGFTEDCSAHRYLRRTLLWNTMLGSPAELQSTVLT